MTRASRTVGLCALGVLLLSACSPTTYDSTKVTDPTTVEVSTTVLSGSPAELLPQMLAEVQALSLRVSNNDNDGAAATRIEELWAAIKPGIEATQPALIEDFEFVVRRCRAAADRNRPADADRAFKNLDALVSAYLG